MLVITFPISVPPFSHSQKTIFKRCPLPSLVEVDLLAADGKGDEVQAGVLSYAAISYNIIWHLCMYIYIYTEREREIDIHAYVYIYICIYIEREIALQYTMALIWGFGYNFTN